MHSPEEFRALLQRERARSDRSEHPFSLLTFAWSQPPAAAEPFAPLIEILQRRLRCYDQIGWFEPARLGVVLPETPSTGAWKVADDVLRVYPMAHQPPQCEVYTYPSDWSLLDEQEPRSESWEAAVDRPVRRMESLFVQALPRWKRTLDIAGALLGMILFSPVLAGAALGVKLSSRGPVLFKQWRAGAGNRRFVMYKFRTMYPDAELRKQGLWEFNEQDGPAFKIRHDPRVTRLGRILRRTSIDELPQFWNVLKGDMSLVGPRPLPCDESDSCLPWQKRRLDVTPGLTCIWQVHGRSRVSFDEWIRMDMRYINARSPAEDLKLLMQTVWAVILRKGAC